MTVTLSLACSAWRQQCSQAEEACGPGRRDHGWIHTLLEEAENERMHLLTFMQLTQPGPIMRGMVLVAQVRPWTTSQTVSLASTCS